jgi:hypothetical protein
MFVKIIKAPDMQKPARSQTVRQLEALSEADIQPIEVYPRPFWEPIDDFTASIDLDLTETTRP